MRGQVQGLQSRRGMWRLPMIVASCFGGRRGNCISHLQKCRLTKMCNSKFLRRSSALALVFLFRLTIPADCAPRGIDSDLETWDEFQPNGDGTVSYQVHVRNNGETLTCCQIDFDWMDTRFAIHKDRRAICVYPGHDEWEGAAAVTGGVGCRNSFDNKTECSSGGSSFKFTYRVHDCRHPNGE